MKKHHASPMPLIIGVAVMLFATLVFVVIAVRADGTARLNALALIVSGVGLLIGVLAYGYRWTLQLDARGRSRDGRKIARRM